MQFGFDLNIYTWIGFDMNIYTSITTGKNFKVDDSKFSLIGVNLSFLKNLKITITIF